MSEYGRDYPDKAHDSRRVARQPSPEELHGYLSKVGNSTTRLMSIHKVEEATSRQDQFHTEDYR